MVRELCSRSVFAKKILPIFTTASLMRIMALLPWVIEWMVFYTLIERRRKNLKFFIEI